MASLYPFRALRPVPSTAAAVAAVPYDVVDVEEARILAEGNPLSFLRVSRPEIELPPDTDVHSDTVYERAARNYERLTKSSFALDAEPSVYFYRLRMGAHEQLGVAGCFSIDEYDRDVIKKHERTRRDKEDDRTRHMLALGAQTGPVFLTYRAAAEVDRIAATVTKGEPIIDFTAPDQVRHTLWCVHRAASAARARAQKAGAEAATMLAVAFPHDQVQILSYNRTLKDLGGLSPDG